MSSIMRNGKSHRPAWNYITQGSAALSQADGDAVNFQVLEMLESVRNVLEQVCDELHGIRKNTNKPRRKKAVTR